MAARSNSLGRMGCSIGAVAACVGALGCDVGAGAAAERPSVDAPIATTELPAPDQQGTMTLQRALARRRSVREYRSEPLTTEQLGQLLWSAQGLTASWGGRTAPSAGALHPLEIYVATRDGLLHYAPDGHGIELLSREDVRPSLAEAGGGAPALRDAPAVFVFAAVVERTAKKYGERAERYVLMEVGHAAQNLLLQAVALDLGSVVIGAFSEDAARSALALPDAVEPLYLVPVGRPAP